MLDDNNRNKQILYVRMIFLCFSLNYFMIYFSLLIIFYIFALLEKKY